MKKLLLLSLTGVYACALSAVAQDSVGGVEAKVAVELARNKLAKELHLDVAGIDVASSEPTTWPDSSLGCGKPGEQSLQVITAGHEVLLKTSKGTYRVHATDKHAVVCGAATEWRNPRNVGLPLKNLNAKMDSARADLAARLGAPANEIRTQNFVAAEWPDSSMDCVVEGEQVVNQATKGYRIALRYHGRIYTYHTDLDRVRACPAISAE